MIKLCEINECNWLKVISLSVSNDQKEYLDSPVGIIARGYVYRDHRAKVYAILHDNEPVGLALVKDLDEEPACYDLQQFLIDKRFQGKGFGTKALSLLLDLLEAEQKYECTEVCVDKRNAAALRLFQKAGFTDTGYTDPELPGCMNLRFAFSPHSDAALHGSFAP